MKLSSRTRYFTSIVFALAFLLPGTRTPALAADHSNLEEGLPVTLTDAYPIGYLGREIWTRLEYRHTHEGREAFVEETHFEYGFPRNGQLSVSVPFLFGEEEPEGIGDVALEAFYNFNQETLFLPAFAGAAEAAFPSGEESHGTDTTLKAIMTKSIPYTFVFQQLHANFEITFNDDALEEERSRHYEWAVGYSRRLNTETMWIVDFVRRKEKEENREVNLIETGVRYQLTPLSVLSAGVGFGIGDESPDVTATAGVQIAF